MHDIFIIWSLDLTHKINTHSYKKWSSLVYKLSNYSYNKICEEHTVDMLLHSNTIDEFLITRSIDVKRVHYKDPWYFWTYHSLQEIAKSTRAKITYNAPLISYVIYDGPDSPS
jgi:hypothetical protein